MHAAPPQPASDTIRIWAVVPAAGLGLRAIPAQAQRREGLPRPAKQYWPLLGESLITHTLRALSDVAEIERLLVVLAPDDRDFDTQVDRTGMPRLLARPVGGATRAESVRGGLLALRELGAQAHDWVLVHDAARCLVTSALIERLIAQCRRDTVGGLLALPLPDTLKQQTVPAGNDAAAPRVATTISRAGKWLAQTPQMFRLGLLQTALDLPDLSSITDEASAIEALGHQPLLVASHAQNFKVTYPDDFALAEAVLRARQSQDARLTTFSHIND
ncbi:2-C-methyl-D-erythritol 4-phosphate cytidylyltransferase [Corticibacter populi]|uniref:2-C-methyl-D-erythritol 4-phosphate cytidylyltransferase n=1 Tax=Corticibacter populi TaxID=1550736 RepID=A0A3M6QS48_9BURK|nr:2-C-methyl-D-erythritol 4-phosphate cytidylyltransferase [Corticibacter populi]RMX05813.1 2-C-methyl-D-erythritol 4-phosphate cytidylyltransferase [Corticibacter populi]RZS30875.1 2-C-methyl-D-erythritol 4-phosphate cytidylyltransferase [Corticibacter populi]